MNLSYIHLGLDYDDYSQRNNNLRYEFQQRTNFIDDFFSKAIRKHRIKTDGTFNMISVSPTEFEIKPNSIIPIDTLRVNLPFEKAKYEKTLETRDCAYYLELLERGFRKASEFKIIPLEVLLSLIEEFKQAGCKNEWLYKKKRFKEDDLEVILTCSFTTDYFQLIVTINQISTKKELVSGVVMRSEPGVSIHEGMFKDVVINENIVILDKSRTPRVIIRKDKVFKGILDFVIIGDKEIKEILSYRS